MLEALKVIILGIVQGITEWLPISSTGHLILVEELMQTGAERGLYEYVQRGDPAWCDHWRLWSSISIS